MDDYCTYVVHCTLIEIQRPRLPTFFIIIAEGDYFGVHADFNCSPMLNLHRRESMPLSFKMSTGTMRKGGHLEFWNTDMAQGHQRIAPLSGRFTVF